MDPKPRMNRTASKPAPHVAQLINHDLSAEERDRLIDVTAQPFRERIDGDLRDRFPMRLTNPDGSQAWLYARYVPNVQHPFAVVTTGLVGADGAVEILVKNISGLTIDEPSS